MLLLSHTSSLSGGGRANQLTVRLLPCEHDGFQSKETCLVSPLSTLSSLRTLLAMPGRELVANLPSCFGCSARIAREKLLAP